MSAFPKPPYAPDRQETQPAPPPPPLPPEANTIVHVLRWRAAHQPDRRVFSFLEDGKKEAGALTFRELDRQARRIASQLCQRGAVGRCAILLYPPGLDYISAFLGCLYAGVIAVPTYPPDPARLDRTLPRFLSIVRNTQPALGLTTAPLQALVQFLSIQHPDLHGLPWLKSDEITREPVEERWNAPDAGPESLAFLQFTSGSTSEPKGVMLTHSNLMHNLAMIQRAMNAEEGARAVFWLPFYHDMGLIGGVLGPVYCGVSITLMSPIHFIQHPLHWLEAITQTRAEISGGPNFAYDLCVRKITPEQRASLDLSSWKVAFNGAEPIRAETIERFASTFAGCGFRKEAFFPCYGLAEATLLVASGKRSCAPVFKTVQTSHLAQDQVALAGPGDPNARTLVSSGHPCAGLEVQIVDPESCKPCPEGRIGEVWVSGPSIADGYWKQAEASRQTFQAYPDGSQPDLHPGPYLRTGDLGFLQDGELYIAGRLKDLIIAQGLNHYPQDIELTVEKSHPALRPGSCAAFAIDRDGKDLVVVIAEASSSRGKSAGEAASSNFDPEEVRRAIRQAVSEKHELRLHDIVLIRPGSLPKTSSGKVQRYACRRAYQGGSLEAWKP
jgi:acyl-CoA synthetase (AMP-forming)/AMP-acid ligase II